MHTISPKNEENTQNMHGCMEICEKVIQSIVKYILKNYFFWVLIFFFFFQKWCATIKGLIKCYI